jgi:hypothetical protein
VKVMAKNITKGLLMPGPKAKNSLPKKFRKEKTIWLVKAYS